MAQPSGLASVEQIQTLLSGLNNASKSYTADSSPAAVPNRLQMIGLAKELILGLMEPGDVANLATPMAWNHLTNAFEVAAVRTLLDLQVLKHIPPQGSISLKDLATASNCEESLIERLLRIVVCTGFARQLEDLTYAHTKFSLAYTAMPGPGLFFQLCYDESFLMIDNLHLFLRAKGRHEPIDQKYSPYSWKSGKEGRTVWDIMADHPERLHAFQAGLAFADSQIPLIGYYDFSQLNTPKESDRPILVDVGGGGGQSIIQILEKYPELDAKKFVLQDLKDCLDLARERGVLSKDVVLMENDFWEDQPVKGAKSYLVRRVLHDYSDPFCITILKHISAAMAPDSVLLIGDMVLPERADPSDAVSGMWSMLMFNMAGKERTPAGFSHIFKEAGLELVKIHTMGAGALVEAKLA